MSGMSLKKTVTVGNVVKIPVKAGNFFKNPYLDRECI